MFRAEDILTVRANNVSARGLMQALDQVAKLYDEGYRLCLSTETLVYQAAKMRPWKIPMVKVGTKTIEELEMETPTYIKARFSELPSTPTVDALDSFCTKYGIEVDQPEKQPVSRYKRFVKSCVDALQVEEVIEQEVVVQDVVEQKPIEPDDSSQEGNPEEE